MPWKNTAPEWIQAALLLMGMALSTWVGTAMRIMDQVREGDRSKFWSRRLFVDAIGTVFMILVSAGIADYLELGLIPACALAAILGRGGPPLIDRAVDSFLARLKRSK